MSPGIPRVRPARPLAPIAVTVAILVGWWLVAHNSGAGWVQALGDVAFGTLLIGMVGPAVVLTRRRVRAVRAPTDTTAGLPAEVALEASTRLRVRPVDPPGIESFIGPVRKRRSTTDTVTLVPSRRGTHDALVVDVATAAPFGLQWWTRRMVVRLPSTLYVGPRRGEPVYLSPRPRDHTGDATERVVADVGEPRGARPYRPGDDRRHVHWQASAHTGELMVREREGPSAMPLTLRVALPDDIDQAERVAEKALGTIVHLLDRGAPLVLETVEPSGPVQAPVEDRRSAGRRLSRAVAAPGGRQDRPVSAEVAIEVTA
jgi:uncharacterized protein (DUF58 family)